MKADINVDAFISNLEQAIALKQQLLDDEILSLATSIHQKYTKHLMNQVSTGWISWLFGRKKSELLLTRDDVQKIISDYSKKCDWYQLPFKKYPMLSAAASKTDKDKVCQLFWERNKIKSWQNKLNDATHLKNMGAVVITDPGNLSFMDFLGKHDQNIQ